MQYIYKSHIYLSLSDPKFPDKISNLNESYFLKGMRPRPGRKYYKIRTCGMIVNADFLIDNWLFSLRKIICYPKFIYKWREIWFEINKNVNFLKKKKKRDSKYFEYRNYLFRSFGISMRHLNYPLSKCNLNEINVWRDSKPIPSHNPGDMTVSQYLSTDSLIHTILRIIKLNWCWHSIKQIN